MPHVDGHRLYGVSQIGADIRVPPRPVAGGDYPTGLMYVAPPGVWPQAAAGVGDQAPAFCFIYGVSINATTGAVTSRREGIYRGRGSVRSLGGPYWQHEPHAPLDAWGVAGNALPPREQVVWIWERGVGRRAAH